MSDAPTKDVGKALRQNLMRVGGTFTVIMSGANLMPEELANHAGMTEDAVLKTLTGSNQDITVAQLAKIAALLGGELRLSLVLPQQAKAEDAKPAPIPSPAPLEQPAA